MPFSIRECHSEPALAADAAGERPGFCLASTLRLRHSAFIHPTFLATQSCTNYGTLLAVAKGKRQTPAPEAETAVRQKRIAAIFFRTEAGGEPVREWLKSLSRADRKLIGADIMTVEFGWPIGMPVCRPLGHGLYEVRTSLSSNRIARVLFYVDKRGRMVLLHGFIKKTQKTPVDDLNLAAGNKSKHERGLK